MSALKERVVRRSPSRGAGSPDVWGIYDPDMGSIPVHRGLFGDEEGGTHRRRLELRPEALPDRSRQHGAGAGHRRRAGADGRVGARHAPARRPLDGPAHLKERTGAPNAIGDKVHDIARLWSEIYNMPDAFDPDRDFDGLFAEGETFRIGELEAGDAVARAHAGLDHLCHRRRRLRARHADVPGRRHLARRLSGRRWRQLWDSIQEILALPPETRLFVGHDYGTEGRDEPKWEATVAEHKAKNKHVKDGTARDEWIRIREERDKTLALPNRILAALQVNLRGGRLPPAESDGRHYLVLPVDRF